MRRSFGWRQRGWVRGRGAYVTEVSLQSVKDAFEIQSYLAGLVGRLAPERATQEELAAMVRAIERKDADQCAQVLRSHLARFIDEILSFARSEDEGSGKENRAGAKAG
ncbi:hypothetical protein H5T53_06670 [Candidatus Bipolaricaulota bacterium]|nr:hypothetical protein [Candidatus Bipolaricaulota bacterium]